MYSRWRFQRWETPVSDLKSVGMVSLIDDGTLQITIEDLRDPRRLRWRFAFSQAPIYQNILEEYRLGSWSESESRAEAESVGWTATIPESPWLAGLREQEPLLDVHFPGLRHYQIATEDDVVDVLSADAPRIDEIPPGAPGDPPVGKSTILYADEDADEVRRLFDDLSRKGEM